MTALVLVAFVSVVAGNFGFQALTWQNWAHAAWVSVAQVFAMLFLLAAQRINRGAR